MTIGIGVLATGDEGRKTEIIPDHAILISDTMGSFGDEYSHPRLHKRFDLPDEGLFIVAADQIDKAAEVVPMIKAVVAAVPPQERSYGRLLASVGNACFMYKADRFKMEIMPKHRIPPDSFSPFDGPKELNDLLGAEWQKFELEFQLLIAAFDRLGQAHLIFVDGREGTAQGRTLPGFCAIGSGAGNAMFWLAHRGHTLGMKPLRALYHAYEAKVMADDAPNVNEHVDILVARADASWSFSSHFNEEEVKALVSEIPTVSLGMMFEKFGPRSTDELDTIKAELIKLSAFRKSAGQQ
jgi:hypothetical protein